jgi:cytochrome P450 family 6
MFPIIKACGQGLEDYLAKNVNNGVDVFEFRDLLARYSTNIISSVAFGIENDCINEPNHIFRKMGAKIFKPNFKNGIRGMTQLLIPQMFYKFGLRSVDDDVEEFIFSIVNQTVEYREKNNITRNDLMQALIQLKNQGYVAVDKKDENIEVDKKKLTMNEVAAQCLVFYLAGEFFHALKGKEFNYNNFIEGFETTSSTMSFCLFELARNKNILQKVQEEIDEAFKNAGSDGITYEMLDSLKYLECCVDETLRFYPPLPFLFRGCLRDYKVPGSDLVIPKGTSVLIPMFGLHRDPEIYENPMQFKPERFLDSATGNGISKGLFYTPFGDGQRICIGNC